MQNILNLNDLSNIDALIEEYNLNVIDGTYICLDADLEELFKDSKINCGDNLYQAKEFNYDDDYQPVGCHYGDYLYTIPLTQNHVTYYCQVFCVYNGVGADTGLALWNL